MSKGSRIFRRCKHEARMSGQGGQIIQLSVGVLGKRSLFSQSCGLVLSPRLHFVHCKVPLFLSSALMIVFFLLFNAKWKARGEKFASPFAFATMVLFWHYRWRAGLGFASGLSNYHRRDKNRNVYVFMYPVEVRK